MNKTILAGIVIIPLILSNSTIKADTFAINDSNIIKHEVYSANLKQQKTVDEMKDQFLKDELIRQASVDFDKYNVTSLSYVTYKELVEVLKHTKNGDGLIPYADYFIEAEKEYRINAFFLCAIAAQESGWGDKPAGDGTNLTGYAVYTSYSNGKTFEDGVRSNILETARLIADDYTSPKGKYNIDLGYEGKSVEEINQNYCLQEDQKTPKMSWSKSVSKIATGFNNTYHELFGQV